MEPSAPVSYDDLLAAFDWVSALPVGNSAYVSRATGQTHWASSVADLEDELPDDYEDVSIYVAVPHKRDLDLGNKLALKFTEEYLPGSLDAVYGFFRRRGAYAHFKDLLNRKDCLEVWFQHETLAVERALRQWCSLNGVTLKESRHAEVLPALRL